MRNLQGIIIFGCLLLAASASGEGWRFPDSKSVRIDTKVRILDDQHTAPASARDNNNKDAYATPQEDEIPFKEPTNTEGFYNRPPGSGRYPMRVEEPRSPYRINPYAIVPVTSLGHRRLPLPPAQTDAAGTLDSFKYCKCVSTPDCNPAPNSNHACGSGKYLCCYKKAMRGNSKNSEFFNEIEDERPDLYPNREIANGAFSPTPGEEFHGVFGNSAQAKRPEVLVGPGGPTGHIGPAKSPNANYPPVLVGPDGPTGMIGPIQNDKDTNSGASAQFGVLVGPGGPTGIIGPNRGVLVGPRGPTGIIGPNRGVLVGPGGPTGRIGPSYNRQSNPGILVGPGGPTGIIGPGRQLLVGPGGPTGYIGPRRPYDFSGLANKAAINSAIKNTSQSNTTSRTATRNPQGTECKNKSHVIDKKNGLKRNITEGNWEKKCHATSAPSKVRKPRGIISDFIIPKVMKQEDAKTEATDFRAGKQRERTETKKYGRVLKAKENNIDTENFTNNEKKRSNNEKKHSKRLNETTTKARQKRFAIAKLLFPKILENIKKHKDDPLISVGVALAILHTFSMFY